VKKEQKKTEEKIITKGKRKKTKKPDVKEGTNFENENKKFTKHSKRHRKGKRGKTK
jgi:hypothetical protein